MKQILFTDKAPAPIGPYSQAVLAGDTLYISGQIALHPETKELIIADIETETHRVMENLRAILENAQMTFENVVKTGIFLADMDDFAKVNAVYAGYISENTAPARETIEVSGLPKGVNVEISMIAVR